MNIYISYMHGHIDNNIDIWSFIDIVANVLLLPFNLSSQIEGKQLACCHSHWPQHAQCNFHPISPAVTSLLFVNWNWNAITCLSMQCLHIHHIFSTNSMSENQNWNIMHQCAAHITQYGNKSKSERSIRTNVDPTKFKYPHIGNRMACTKHKWRNLSKY